MEAATGDSAVDANGVLATGVAILLTLFLLRLLPVFRPLPYGTGVPPIVTPLPLVPVCSGRGRGTRSGDAPTVAVAAAAAEANCGGSAVASAATG